VSKREGSGPGAAVAAVLAIVVAACPVRGQEPATLTLDEALELARRNNPTYLSTQNDEGAAAWRVREAYAGFLPQASVRGGMRYEDEGAALYGSLTAADLGVTNTPSYYFSSYSARATLDLSPQTWFNVSQQRASRRAVEAGVRAAELTLETAVTRAYLTVLRARDDVELRRQQLERAEENLTLAETRAEAGVTIPLDAKQAEVERGRAQVDALTARSDYATARLRLLQQLGVELETEVRLTTEFAVFEPGWSRASLMETARASHPALRELEETARAQRAAARTAWSSYLPTLSAEAVLSGFTRQVGNDRFLVAQGAESLARDRQRCEDNNELSGRLADPFPMQDCSVYELTDSRLDSLEAAVVASNRAFPFDFQESPLSLSLVVSLPVFTGFTRQRQVAEASAAADDTDHFLKAERLRLNADVAAAHLRLETAYEAVQIEERNRAVAAEQLEQARERYRVGLDSFIQLTEAETLKSEADQAYLGAVYTFHEALADLEAAVGRPLRPEG
jgi:outer membrane protein